MDKPPLKLTVIVPVYKTEPYLRRCIDSILAQTLTNFELILVDDGSPDNCPAICDEYAKRDNRIKVLHKENGGLGLVRKVGVDIANGEYIAFVDSDDWIEPEMYEILYRTAVDNTCDMVICDWKCHYLETHTTVAHTQSQTLKENYLYDSGDIQKHLLSKVLLEEIHGYSWNKLYRSNILKQCNLGRGVNLQNMQDWVLNCEYFNRTRRMMYVKECMYNYAIHSGNALQGSHKDYLSIILKIHELRMTFLKEFNMDGRHDVRLGCINRFMKMAFSAAFRYEFLFEHIKFKEKLKRISAVVNNAEVRINLPEYHKSISRQGMLSRVQWILFSLRFPLLIYGFAKSVEMASKIKSGLQRSFNRTR